MLRPGLAVLLLPVAAALVPAPAGAAVRIFPSDAQTVADDRQVTGRRVHLALPDCARRASDCAELRRLNRLDGFDVQPRVRVRFERAIDVAQVSRRTLWLRRASGGPRIRLVSLVYDARTRTLTGTPASQLRAAATYEVRVAATLGGRAARATFTTMSTSVQTSAMARRARAARPRLSVAGSIAAGGELRRLVDRGGAAPVEEVVPNLAATGAERYVFGTLTAPSWLSRDRTIAETPTRRSPRPRASARSAFALIVPAGDPPAGGWPVAIFGHGFLRSHYDVFVAADRNAAAGVATIGIDAVGHGGGPRGAVLSGATRIPAPGRARDFDGNGAITDLEGMRTPVQPDPAASVALRDTLRQTALDTVSLVAALRRGVPGVPELSRSAISYYGQSLGGIYGTMATALEPALRRGVLNVPGGPIIDVSRLSPSFRPLVISELALRRPPLTAPGTDVPEQLPLRGQAPETAPIRAALAVQEVIARVAWLGRSGSPEAYAPLLRGREVLLQAAYGDQTVPNPTTAAIVRAGGLQDRAWVFRNDRTPAAATNPHGFLIGVTSPGRAGGQAQALAYLRRGRIVDPDGAGGVFEPLRGTLLEARNF